MTPLFDITYYNFIKDKLSSPHTGELSFESCDAIKSICSLINPSNILELGFNRGMSALMFLENSSANVHSIDVLHPQNIQSSLDYLYKTYKNRFLYTSLNHNKLSDDIYIQQFKNKYDLVFIDGDHSLQAVTRDIQNTLNFNVRYIFLDDYLHKDHGKDIKNCNLKIVQQFDTGCGHILTENPYYAI